MCFINNKCVISLIDKKFSTDPKDFFFLVNVISPLSKSLLKSFHLSDQVKT